VGAANPHIYDPLLSAYAIDLALALASQLGSELVYCSLTDYVQHKGAPGSELADSFYAKLDERVSRALEWAASEMCRQLRLIWPPSFGHGRRCLRGSVPA
jgi:phosphonoacetate hydrolase